jgi:hypothetical protein
MINAEFVEAQLRARTRPMDDRSIATIVESLRAANSPRMLSELIARDAVRFGEENTSTGYPTSAPTET